MVNTAGIENTEMLAELHKLLDVHYSESILLEFGLAKLTNREKESEKESHDINQSTLGKTHHKTIKSRSALGVLAYAQGDYPKSLEHFEFVARSRLDRLGDKHILTASAFNRLGATYYEAAKYDLAELNLNRALMMFKKLNLSESMKYARTLNNLGLVERQNKQYKQAQKTFLKAKKIEIKNLGESHIDVAGLNNNLGMAAADLSEINKALLLFTQAYTVMYEQTALKNVNIAFL